MTPLHHELSEAQQRPVQWLPQEKFSAKKGWQLQGEFTMFLAFCCKNSKA